MKTDVIITGGGLAGLGLAHQLVSETPGLAIVVLEKQRFPRPKAIAKVGESTVEIGSRYLAKHLGLEAHLQQEQLKKFGLRIFLGEPADDFAQQDELGASSTFGIPTYQIDRGIIENELARKVRAAGVTVLDDASVSAIDIQPRGHTVAAEVAGEALKVEGRWLLDASGRAALVKNTLGLAASSSHRGNAVWFRVDRRIEIDDWSTDAAWRERCSPPGRRWLSTNHLVGPGYWVWIIPLSSGATSIGIVMDDQAFDEAGIDSEAAAIRWLEQHQRRCAEALAGARFLDFVVLPDYAYECKQLFGGERWAITGEAGFFADPFYSPGSDFIAISNCFIADLVSADLRGQDIAAQRIVSEKIFRSIYASTLSLYQGTYGGFGDRKMMALKLLWDYSYYWGVLSLLFFNDALGDMSVMRLVNPLLQQAQGLNAEVQQVFCRRAQQRLVLSNQGVFIDQYRIPCLHLFNQQLMAADGSSTVADVTANLARLRVIAGAVDNMLSDHPDRSISEQERALLGDYRERVA